MPFFSVCQTMLRHNEVVLLNLLVMVINTLCDGKEVLHCTAKPGCQFSSCDPITSDWNETGFDIEQYLRRKEFPITCHSNNSPNIAPHLNSIHVNQKEIRQLKAEVKKLNAKQEEAKKDVIDLKLKMRYSKTETSRDNQNVVSRLHILEQQVAYLTKENQDLKNSFEKINKSSTLSNESFNVTGKQNTTDDDMTTITSNKDTTTKGNCDVTYNAKCFRVFAYIIPNISFSNAEYLCNNKLANIYDAVHYYMLETYLRSIIPDVRSWYEVLTGMKYENDQLLLTSGKTTSLLKELWWPGYPYSESDASYTNVVLRAHKTRGFNQGIWNYPPSTLYNGAICEI
ncbi:uncharacterized protein LOC144421897 isoform X1 [Styela clava]